MLIFWFDVVCFPQNDGIHSNRLCSTYTCRKTQPSLLYIMACCIFGAQSYIISWSNTWWRHQMETSSALLALCAGNPPVPVNSPHKGQWRGALMFSLICVWINDWVNNREAGDLRRHSGHYDVNVMSIRIPWRGIWQKFHKSPYTFMQEINQFQLPSTAPPI